MPFDSCWRHSGLIPRTHSRDHYTELYCLTTQGTYCLILTLFSVKDFDECEVHQDDCGQHATCVNTDGSFYCTCNDGYDGDGRTCEGKILIVSFNIKTFKINSQWPCT